MILKSKIIGLTILVATTLSMAGCTVPTTEAGNTQTYYEGKITGIELIDMKTNRNDNTKNTLLGAVGGALLGNLIGKNSTGTAIGAGAGALAGNALSEYGYAYVKGINGGEIVSISQEEEKDEYYTDGFEEDDEFEIEVEFEPVKYEKFIESINLPPYSPFIVDAKIKK